MSVYFKYAYLPYHFFILPTVYFQFLNSDIAWWHDFAIVISVFRFQFGWRFVF